MISYDFPMISYDYTRSPAPPAQGALRNITNRGGNGIDRVGGAGAKGPKERFERQLTEPARAPALEQGRNHQTEVARNASLRRAAAGRGPLFCIAVVLKNIASVRQQTGRVQGWESVC